MTTLNIAGGRVCLILFAINISVNSFCPFSGLTMLVRCQ